MSPKVTIATITYNSSQYVRYAIESVLAQSFTNFEYLISDDCSTDNTWEIIQQYHDPRIKAWRNENNLGEYPNRNKTLKEATGEYIIWIDGDDIFYPHGLEFMVKMLDAFPESAMACARPYWPNMVYPYELTPRETYLHDYLGSPVTINGFPDTLIKTAILKSLGGLPENFISGDTYVKKEIALNHKILLISNGVSWWRMPEGQASARVRGTVVGAEESMRMALHFLKHLECPLNEHEKAIAIQNIKAGYLRLVVRKLLFQFKLSQFWHYWHQYIDSQFSKIKYLKTPIQLPYNGGATGNNPLQLPFYMNPFTNPNKSRIDE